MKSFLVTVASITLTYGCVSPSYLELVETEVTKTIDSSLVCNGDYFYEELELFFKEQVTINELFETSSLEGSFYYYYLKQYAEGGGKRLEWKQKNKEGYQRLLGKLQCSGFGLAKKEVELTWYGWVEPTFTKYKEHLIKENREDELIFGIGSTGQPAGSIAISLVAKSMLEKYKINDFKRPFLKRFVVLFCFTQLEMKPPSVNNKKYIHPSLK